MKASNIYSHNLAYLRRGQRRLINQGGQYSGKTVNIEIALAQLAAEDEDPGVTTITSMSFPHLKMGALRDFEMYVYPQFKSAIRKYHKTDHLFTFKNGSMIEFRVFETEMDARGGKRKRLFVNEANSFDWMTFFQLDSRSEQTIIDYNPSLTFWAHEKLIGENGNRMLISDHRNNPFLTEDKHHEVESICTFAYDEFGNKIFENGKPVILKGDYELWKVYARGVTGNVRGIIFPNWEQIDLDMFPEDDGSEVFCIDFGYTIDPTAVMKLKLVGDVLYVKELAYRSGLTPLEIVTVLMANGYDDDIHSLFCEHDKDMIRQIRYHGCTNATTARKGDGSLKAGIMLLKGYKVKYWGPFLKKELLKYIWTVNKEGETTNVPIDAHNHAIDATRYGAYSRFVREEQAA